MAQHNAFFRLAPQPMIRSCICFDIDRNLVALHKFQLFPGRQINQAGSLVTVVPLLGKPQQFLVGFLYKNAVWSFAPFGATNGNVCNGNFLSAVLLPQR
ncbi:MAG: hypothetical protein ACLRYE_10360, partial [Gemmiger formicilis]|uniref:hypothetical protein n=1 Tax=Gemmiger formicilis TaxID=745368 RepID=UPI0039A3C318